MNKDWMPSNSEPSSNPVELNYEWGGNKLRGRFWHEVTLHIGELSCGTPCCRILWISNLMTVQQAAKQTHGRWINWWLITEMKTTSLWSSWMVHGSRNRLRATRTVQIVKPFLCAVYYFCVQNPLYVLRVQVYDIKCYWHILTYLWPVRSGLKGTAELLQLKEHTYMGWRAGTVLFGNNSPL